MATVGVKGLMVRPHRAESTRGGELASLIRLCLLGGSCEEIVLRWLRN